jgi:hypothetical protein
MKFDESSVEQEVPSFVWRSRGTYRNTFSMMITMLYVNETDSWHMLGGQGTRETNLQYINRKIKVRA